MGGGGGGKSTTTTSSEASYPPEFRPLAKSAVEQIQELQEVLPLSTFATSAPRLTPGLAPFTKTGMQLAALSPIKSSSELALEQVPSSVYDISDRLIAASEPGPASTGARSYFGDRTGYPMTGRSSYVRPRTTGISSAATRAATPVGTRARTSADAAPITTLSDLWGGLSDWLAKPTSQTSAGTTAPSATAAPTTGGSITPGIEPASLLRGEPDFATSGPSVDEGPNDAVRVDLGSTATPAPTTSSSGVRWPIAATETTVVPPLEKSTFEGLGPYLTGLSSTPPTVSETRSSSGTTQAAGTPSTVVPSLVVPPVDTTASTAATVGSVDGTSLLRLPRVEEIPTATYTSPTTGSTITTPPASTVTTPSTVTTTPSAPGTELPEWAKGTAFAESWPTLLEAGWTYTPSGGFIEPPGTVPVDPYANML